MACNRQPAQDATQNEAVPPQQTADASIQTSVQAGLYADDSVRGEDLEVRVDDGIVTLQGAVSSAATKQQAVVIARGVDGVRRVDDQISVGSPAQAQADPRGDEGFSPSAAANNPAWITTKIQAQYFMSPDIKPWNVEVTTSSAGVVELRGEVDSIEAKSEAVRIARATEGVASVEDDLRVRSETEDAGELEAAAEDVSDAWLTAKIQAKYFLDDEVKARDIDVGTDDRMVTLTGTVFSELERRQAVAIARNTDGVRDVRDQLQVSAQTAAQQADTRGTAGREIIAGIQDPWITTKIQSQFFLDPEVKGHRIDVDTENGVVTLSGNVASDARRDLAERIAGETDGVQLVVNRLTVAAER